MYRSFISGVVASALGLASVAQVAGHPVCRPKLTVTGVQFSEMIPPTLERKWTATVIRWMRRVVRRIVWYFDLGITRLKEMGTSSTFREQFIWLAPSVKIGVDFWADEAVERYWLSDVAACPCRD